MAINFNVEPYYDDYDEAKGFHKILFKPAVAVQARELTQLQTILQKQIERFGSSIYKDGAMVIPGQASVDTKVFAVKLQSTSLNLESLFSSATRTVTGATTGVVATVLKGINAEGNDPPTIIVRITKTGSNAGTTTFTTSETLTISDTTSTITTVATSPVTNSSIASIQDGVYFALNNFVKVFASTIVLDKYSNTPSYRIGLAITEDFITEADDSSLNDNAIGSYNENAPGAHRYKISLALDKLSLASTLDEDFIELIRIENGVVKKVVDKTEYSQLERTLARRTYDESGDYTVRPFRIQIREHRDNNRGTWSASKANILIGDVVTYSGNTYIATTNGTTGGTPPTHRIGTASDGSITWEYTDYPTYNRGVYSADAGGDTNKLAIGLEPGKAYVRGYEIEKISTEYIPVSKARDTQSVSTDIIATVVGNYVEVSNIFANAASLVDVGNDGIVNLYDAFTVSRGVPSGNIVGTARIRALDYASGNVVTGVFNLSLFDVNMLSGRAFERSVKQIANVSGTSAFTADINPNYIKLTGTINTAASVVVTGAGTLANSEITVGDYIYFDSPTPSRRRVVAVNNDYSFNVDSVATITNSSYYRIEAPLKDPVNFGLIYQLPYYVIRDTTNQQYTTTEAITATSTAGGVVTLGGGRTYNQAAARAQDYIVINVTNGNVESPTSISTTSSAVTINGVTAGNNFVIITPVLKTLVAKTKTPTASVLTITDANVFSAAEISLTKADVYRINSIKMAGNTINISDWFNLDDGQRETQYDVSKLIRKPDYPAPTSNITISYAYFAHGAGDYFSANSYTSIQYKDIPVFYGSSGVIRLSDVLDFRPRKDDLNLNFTGTGSSQTQLPRRFFPSQFGYSWYLPRKDKIALDLNGNLFAITGVSSLDPQEPNNPTMGMTLYKLNLEAYTSTAGDPNATFEYIDNKRYTMRDIGALEKRLQIVEYYTALSLLEQETKSLSILDTATGLDRYKNGFIVDNFEGHGIGDVFSPDYRCAVDMENNQLRPLFGMNNVNLVEEQNNESGRITQKYRVTGDLITLRYSSNSLITQQYASRTENVNPFAIATFNGQLLLTPSSDEWFDTVTRPDVIINEEGNFDSVTTLAEQTSVLGTVWNSWQTQWTGVPQTTSQFTQTAVLQRGVGTDFDQRFGVAARRDSAARNNNVGVRSVTLQKTATQVGQARTGVRTSVVARVDTRVLDDRIVSIATIPFIRSRNVAFLARGLRPNANVYAFFDETAVSSYVTPAARATITGITGTFDFQTNAETFDTVAARAARRTASAGDVAFNRGDVVYISASGFTVATSNGTAVVAFVENSSSGNILHLHNIKGSLIAGNPITGTISGATATLVNTVAQQTQGNVLVTNVNGDVAGVFSIPNTDAVRFRTGAREFKLTDSPTNTPTPGTQARTTYNAAGVLETRQSTIASTRNAEIVREAVSEQRTITQSNERVVNDTGWYDPLAQTFLIDQKGGCFLTKVDVYFSQKDTAIPVTCEIREVINGYPGKRVLPFSRTVLTPQSVSTSSDASVATTFTFRSPVYVQEGVEYALVLLSDSNNYRVWISQLGETMVGTDRIISQQPYAGVLFKSQNASTWTADQFQDLKFTMYRAVFDTANTDASVGFVNETIGTVVLPNNPLRFVNNSPVVTVIHPNHSMPSGSNVTLSGYTTQANITLNDINKSHIIGNVLADSYTITVANSSILTTLVGGSNIRATQDIAFNVLQPIVQYQNFPDTSISFNAFTSAGTLSATRSSSPVSIIPNQNNAFLTRQAVKGDGNEVSSTKSFKMTATIASTNDSLSPVIDLNRVSLIAVSNRIDNVNSTTSNFAHNNTTIVSANTRISFAGNNIITSHPAVANLFATVNVGKLLRITGANLITNNANVIVSGVTNVAGNANISCFYSFATESTGNAITLIMADNFIDERAPSGGSATSKYMTRQVNLQYPSQYLRIIFAASVPSEADIDVYYRTGTGTLQATNWNLITPTANIIKTNDLSSFRDVTYEIDNLPAFTTVATKIVFRSTNTSAIPRVKDLRVIACP